jgi:hypothetical protein
VIAGSAGPETAHAPGRDSPPEHARVAGFDRGGWVAAIACLSDLGDAPFTTSPRRVEVAGSG